MRERNCETGGRQVRCTWISWARLQKSPKPSWLVPWEELAEPDKEADRAIWSAICGAYVIPEGMAGIQHAYIIRCQCCPEQLTVYDRAGSQAGFPMALALAQARRQGWEQEQGGFTCYACKVQERAQAALAAMPDGEEKRLLTTPLEETYTYEVRANNNAWDVPARVIARKKKAVRIEYPALGGYLCRSWLTTPAQRARLKVTQKGLLSESEEEGKEQQ